MIHDFDHTDMPECDKTGAGIMSYKSENANNKGWSKCSQSDWKKWWNSNGIACANLDYGELKQKKHSFYCKIKSHLVSVFSGTMVTIFCLNDESS